VTGIRTKLLLAALGIVVAALLSVSLPGWPVWLQALFIALSLVSVGISVRLGHSIVATVEELVAATRRIGESGYEDRVPIRSSDELGTLAGEIDRMRVLLRDKIRQLEGLSRNLEKMVIERTEELKRARDRLELIHEVTDTVNQSLDFDQIFEAVLSGTRRLVDFDQASVARLVDSDTAVVFAISAGSPDLERGRRIRLTGSRIAEVVQTRRPAVFNRAGESGSQDTLLMSAIVREAAIPLTAGDHVVGTFNLGSRRPAAFSPADLLVLVQIASALGTALLRAEAFERERLAARRLKELSDLKSEFVSKVSHELRTPLTSILGAVDNLLDGIAGALEDKLRGYLVRIRDNGNRLLGLINDLLDLARIEAGEEQLRASRFHLAPLVQEVVETVRPLAEGRGVSLRHAAIPELTLLADRDKIARVLLNLVHNGIKFTESGGTVEVSARSDGGKVEIRVADTGVGIPVEEIERIFDKFHQVKRSGGRSGPGSGLGLPISRELARMHGGDLVVQSTSGKGSTFTVVLPPSPPAIAQEAR